MDENKSSIYSMECIDGFILGTVPFHTQRYTVIKKVYIFFVESPLFLLEKNNVYTKFLRTEKEIF